MSSEKAIAIVLRTVEFSETSLIVTAFSREFGKIRGLAKGARRLKGPFEAALDLLGLSRIVFLRKSSDALDLLTEAKLERRFRPTPGDLSCLYVGYYVAELLNGLTDDGDPHPELFDAADLTLRELAAGLDPRALALRFEPAALRVLGHLPVLDRCVECGRPATAPGRKAFSQLAGGVLCPKCKAGKKQLISLSAEALEAMRRLATVNTLPEPPLARALAGELRGVLNYYLAHLLGRQPRLHRYLGGEQPAAVALTEIH